MLIPFLLRKCLRLKHKRGGFKELIFQVLSNFIPLFSIQKLYCKKYTLYCITKRKKFQVKLNYFIFFIEKNRFLCNKTGIFFNFSEYLPCFAKIELT